MAFPLTPETQPFLVELWNSDKLLRYGDPAIVSIDDIVADAWRATALVCVIIQNRVDLAPPESADQNMFRLPGADPALPLLTYDLRVSREAGPWTLELFKEDL